MKRPTHLRTVSRKPEGTITRGKTAANRLRRVDNFLAMYEPSLFTRMDGHFARALFVDLGYGAEATTTLESADRLRKLNPTLPILGVEIDPERVAAARPYADDRTFFRLGGFNLPLQTDETVRCIRAFNVLRQYEEKDFAPAYERLAQYVLPGGLMIEGTSNPHGSIWVANLARKVTATFALSDSIQADPKRLSPIPRWKFEALIFSTNFHRGFDVEEFQTILPKNLIHHVIEGEPIFTFFKAWKHAAAETAHTKVWGQRQWFSTAAEALFAKGYRIDLHRKWLSKGWLIWKQS